MRRWRVDTIGKRACVPKIVGINEGLGGGLTLAFDFGFGGMVIYILFFEDAVDERGCEAAGTHDGGEGDEEAELGVEGGEGAECGKGLCGALAEADEGEGGGAGVCEDVGDEGGEVGGCEVVEGEVPEGGGGGWVGCVFLGVFVAAVGVS